MFQLLTRWNVLDRRAQVGARDPQSLTEATPGAKIAARRSVSLSEITDGVQGGGDCG
jgi:hypothetical protein